MGLMRSSLGWMAQIAFICFDVVFHEANEEKLEELSHLLRYLVTDLYSILDYLIYTVTCQYANDAKELHEGLHSLNFWVCPEKLWYRTNEPQEQLDARKEKEVKEWFDKSVHLKKLAPDVKKQLGDFLLSFQRLKEQKPNGDFHRYVYPDKRSECLHRLHALRNQSVHRVLQRVDAHSCLFYSRQGSDEIQPFVAPPPAASGWQPLPYRLRTVFFQVVTPRIETLPLAKTCWELVDFIDIEARRFLGLFFPEFSQLFVDSVTNLRNELLSLAGRPFQQFAEQSSRPQRKRPL